MTKLRLFHSIWTAPQGSERWDCPANKRSYVDMLCAAISVAFAKKNDCEIALHTDTQGKEVYGWLPYTEVTENLNEHDFDTQFWASGKIISQQFEPLGSIHIDTDVFIKSAKTVELMQRLSEHDLLIQHAEFNYEQSHIRETWQTFVNINGSLHIPEVPELILNPCHAYNCGVVGFNSQELKELYIEGYKKIYHSFKENHFFEAVKKADRNFCPDLIAEQAWLFSAAQAKDAKVLQIFENNHRKDSSSVDYVHLINTSKYFNDAVLKKCEEVLEQIAPDLLAGIKERNEDYLKTQEP